MSLVGFAGFLEYVGFRVLGERTIGAARSSDEPLNSVRITGPANPHTDWLGEAP